MLPHSVVFVPHFAPQSWCDWQSDEAQEPLVDGSLQVGDRYPRSWGEQQACIFGLLLLTGPVTVGIDTVFFGVESTESSICLGADVITGVQW